MTIDHLMLKVKDWPKAKAYYVAALAPLGYQLLMDSEGFGGFHVPGSKHGNIYVKQELSPGRLHFAIQAPSAAAVKEYYAAALEHGGTDNGAPGNRKHYGAEGIGCFVTDLDSNNIEVCYRP